MFEHVRITTLPNGAKIATSAMPGVNSCAVSVFVPTGSRHERKSEAGWSHFAEHMAFKGSERYPSRRAIVRALDRFGGNYNASTGRERTRYEACVPARGTATALGVLGDIASRPLLPEGEIGKERKVILEEIKQAADDPQIRLSQIVSAALWPRHPLGRTVAGTPDSIAPIDAEGLRAFHRAHYASRGTMVLAAGKLEHERIVDLARPFLEALADATAPSFLPASRCRAPEPVAIERRDVKQALVSVSFRHLRFADERLYALYLLSGVLGEGVGSRLFRRIRDRHGLAYSIHSCPGLSSDANTFHVRAEVDAANLEKALVLCGRELRAMATASVGRRELADKKTEFENSLLLVGETSQSQRNNLESSLATWGTVVALETHAARYRAVASEEIRTLAAELFRPKNCTLGLILPHDCKADPEKLREALFNE